MYAPCGGGGHVDVIVTTIVRPVEVESRGVTGDRLVRRWSRWFQPAVLSTPGRRSTPAQ